MKRRTHRCEGGRKRGIDGEDARRVGESDGARRTAAIAARRGEPRDKAAAAEAMRTSLSARVNRSPFAASAPTFNTTIGGVKRATHSEQQKSASSARASLVVGRLS